MSLPTCQNKKDFIVWISYFLEAIALLKKQNLADRGYIYKYYIWFEIKWIVSNWTINSVLAFILYISFCVVFLAALSILTFLVNDISLYRSIVCLFVCFFL
jgi:hypothetical protein